MGKVKTYVFHSDGGHGWIAVKFRELEELEIADKITGFSYRKGKTAYLEEDFDLSIFFLKYREKHGVSPSYRESHRDRSPIRNYDHYSYNKMKGEQNEIV